jgi:hypothetical protein
MSEDKAVEAVALGRRAEQLADLDGRNLIEMGTIAFRMMQDPELPKLDGAKNYDDWMKLRYGKRRKTAYKCRRIVEVLSPLMPQSDILTVGQVKAFELTRLPESEVRKPEWQQKAREMKTATFKEAVKAYLDEKGSDHREEFYTFSARLPKSAKPIVDQGIGLAMSVGGAATKAEALEELASSYAQDPSVQHTLEEMRQRGEIEPEPEIEDET